MRLKFREKGGEGGSIFDNYILFDYLSFYLKMRPGLVSQSVLLWDGIRIKMKRMAHGKWTIVALREGLKMGSEPLYSGV